MRRHRLTAAICAALLMILAPFLPMMQTATVVHAEEAETQRFGDYSYTIGEDETATITHYHGTDTEITIPTMLGGYPVTVIGDKAFYGGELLTSVTIPEGVTEIGIYAFYFCTSLTDLTIPSSVTHFGSHAFADSAWLKAKRESDQFVVVNDILVDGYACKGDVTIPEGVKAIANGAFYHDLGLTSVTVPEGVTAIGDLAFYDCENLKAVTLPESLQTCGNDTFANTAWLEAERKIDPCVAVNGLLVDAKACAGDVVIPEGVTTIGGTAFYHCEDLTSVTIPESVTTIGEMAFIGCTHLATIRGAKGVETIADRAFKDCTSLTAVVLPARVTTLEFGAFKGCTSLTSVTVSEKVPAIGRETFSGCTSLASVMLPRAVGHIAEDAFAGCDALTLSVYRNSYAQNFAEAHAIPYVLLADLLGDVDMDGAVDAKDASDLLVASTKKAVGHPVGLESYQQDVADVNKDDKFDAVDASFILIYSTMKGTGKDVTLEGLVAGNT